MRLVLIVMLLVSLNSWATPCEGARVGSWTNPDGSRGGWVSKKARIEKGAIIAPGAQVCGSAQIKSRVQVLDQAKVGGNTVIEGKTKISGTSHVFARAKVRGSAHIHNSIVCQASVIDGISVKDSDYYCQTEDPEPSHPGDEGKKTLLGIDSDNDGVRDDVEIWINDFYSNTPVKDNYFMRMVMKQYATRYNLILRHKDDKEKVRALYGEVFDTSDCHRNYRKRNAVTLKEEMEATMAKGDEKSELMARFFHTSQRKLNEHKTTKFLHATALVGSKKTETGCYFKEAK